MTEYATAVYQVDILPFVRHSGWSGRLGRIAGRRIFLEEGVPTSRRVSGLGK
jgi:hypothetical protein